MRHLILLFTALAFLCGCNEQEDAFKQPEIVYFEGRVDTVGAIVIIYGRHFNSNTAGNTITFGLQATSPFFASRDSLKVRVPKGATTGPIQVRVGSLSAMSADTFHVLTGLWKRMADTPEGGRFDGVGFELRGKGYIGTGTGGGYHKDMWEFNPAANTWKRVADFPGGLRREAVSFTVGGRAYVGLGTNTETFTSTRDFYAFDNSTGAWTRIDDIPTGSLNNAVGLTIAGKGYVITGGFSQIVLEFDPLMPRWVVKSKFPGHYRTSAVGFVVGDKGYIVGGGSGGTENLKDLWEYDPKHDTWTRKRDIPVGGYEGVGFSLNGKGYVGMQGAGRKDFWCYNPHDNSWTRKTNFPGIASSHASSFVIGEAAYIVNGVLSNAVSPEVWKFED